MMIGLGLGVSFGRGGGFNPRSLWPLGTEAGMWLDPSDAATGYQDSAGTTPGVLNSPVGARVDKRLGSTTIGGPGNHVLQATAPARPTWKLNGAIYSDLMDGVDDGYSTATFVAGTLSANMDCFIALKRNAAGQMAVFSQAPTDGANYFGVMASGSGVSAVSTVGTAWSAYVDGTIVGGVNSVTRGQMDTAMTSGAYHVMEFRNLDLSAWTQFTISLYTGFMLSADDGGVILCPAQSTANRNSIRAYLGAKVGLSL